MPYVADKGRKIVFRLIRFLKFDKNSISLQKKEFMVFLYLLVIVVALIAISFLLFSVRIIFHKSHKFPETSAGHNRELRQRGITCPRHDEIKCWAKKEKNPDCGTCYEHARD